MLPPDTGLFTAQQIEIAARDLQDAAGFPNRSKDLPPDESYSAEAAVNILSPEIRILRERGFSNDRIADLMSGFDICVTADQVAHYYVHTPDNEEIVA